MSSNPSRRHDPPALESVPPIDDRRSTPAPRIDDAELAGFEKSLLFLDDLTGLYNRRFLSHLFADRWRDLTAPSDRLSLVIVDLDLFKDVNDTYGHLAGDRVLREIAELLKSSFRHRDFVIRYGGDEFVIVLPGADRGEAGTLARRARQAIASHRFMAADGARPIEVPVSFSLGAATYPEDGPGGEEVLAVADRRLYRDKRQRQVLSPVSSPRRRLLGAALAAALALVAGLLYFGRPPVTATVPDEPPPAAAAATSVEAKLRERILELQAELESVPVEHPPTRDVFAAYEARILELEGRMAELQRELERRPQPPPAKAGGEASAPADEGPAAPDPPADEPGAAVTREPEAASEPTTAGPATGAPAPASGGGAPAGARAPKIVRPSPLSSVNAQYPAAAVRLRKEATVLVRVLVDASGRAVRAQVVGQRAGLGFDEAASTAALRAVYRPGTRDGGAVEMETLVRVEFKLGG